jgi:hypothetical protein
MSTLNESAVATQEVAIEGTEAQTVTDPVDDKQEIKEVIPAAEGEAKEVTPEDAENAVADDKARKNREGFEKRRQRELMELKIRNEILQKELNARIAPTPAVSDKITREQYPDDEQYLEALADKKATQKVDERFRQLEVEKQRQQVSDSVVSAIDAAKTKYDDFEENFASISHIQVPDSVISAVYRNKDIAPDLLYEIATNHPEVLELPEMEAVGEIVALRKELIAKHKAVQTLTNKKPSAPPPIRPPQASGAMPTLDLSKLRGDDYKRARGFIK